MPTVLPPASAFVVPTLGTPERPSPMANARFVDASSPVLASSDLDVLRPYFERPETIPAFERAGPRSQILFDPAAIGVGIVTCGGLCPGLNDVIRSLVMTAHYMYGVRRIYGFPFGYAGLAPSTGHAPLPLSPRLVTNIQHAGGTILGSSRGPQDVGEMVDTLERLKVGILFTLGGDGTLRGAAALAAEIRRRGLSIAVVGIPKTVDNDLQWTERSFGFATAVEEARRAIMGANTEAAGAWNGVGLVKLMGRHSGFIAAHACLSNNDVNFCLIPEVPFELEGEHGFLQALRSRLEARHHAVIVVAEGSGQDLMRADEQAQHDASGNLKLEDIGVFLRDCINRTFERVGEPVTVKYIDPSYIIRSLPANALDSEFCLMLGQHAVHAGMAGRTDVAIAHWNRRFVHVPLSLATASRRQIDPSGPLWRSVLETTGQPQPMHA
jgi:6-phosphofructokinase 1